MQNVRVNYWCFLFEVNKKKSHEQLGKQSSLRLWKVV